jgi:transposase
LQPGRRNSGQSEPQLHISKEGDPYLRTLLVQGAHHILGPFGADSDLTLTKKAAGGKGSGLGSFRPILSMSFDTACATNKEWNHGVTEKAQASRALGLALRR